MMKKTKKIILPIVFAAWAGAGMYAQQTVVPPSQAASSVGQSINAPVNLQNGTVGINVPLWIVNSSIVSMPISVSYNASGIKPGQARGLPGIGWALNAGGVIFRTVRGLPDEDANGWLNRANEIPFSDFGQNFNMLKKLAEGEIDDMPDLYFFSFPGYSGKFVFDKDGIPRTIPYTPLKIDQVNASKFQIITPDGMKFTFGDNSLAVLDNTLKIYEIRCVNGSMCQDPYASYQCNYNSEWYLTRIETADNEDYISLSYYKSPMANPEYYTDYTQVTVNGQIPNQGDIPYLTGAKVVKNSSTIVLSSITGKTSKAYLTYDATCRTLEKVTIKDVANQPFKEFTFGYDADQLIYIKDNLSTYPPFYFEYNGMPPTDITKVDDWGFFNNSSGKAANYYSLQGILTKIHFPAGGYKAFTYEVHHEGTTNVGGARIQRTETKEIGYGTDKTMVTEYEYAGMRYTSPPEDEYSIWHKVGGILVKAIYKRSFTLYPLGSTEGSHVSYEKVTVQEGSYGENGKTEYYFKNNTDTYCTTYDYPLSSQPGDTYPFPAPVSMEWKRGITDSVLVYRKNNDGSFSLAKKTINLYSEDNVNKTDIYSLKVGYKAIQASTEVDFVRRTVKIPSSTMLLTESRMYTYDLDGKNPVETRASYQYNPANNQPAKIIQYKSLEEKEIITQFLYPPDYTGGFPFTLNNKGITNMPIETITYEWDRSSISGPHPPFPYTNETKVLSGKIMVYDNLGRAKEAWILETPNGGPLEMASFRFSNQLQEGLPESAPQAFSLDTRYYRKEVSYDVYDKGLLVQTTSKDSIPSTTIYSYNYTYPVATIANATYNEVKAALGTNVSLFGNAKPTDETLINTMNSLRDSLPEAFISSRTYNPVHGDITSASGVNGLTSYNVYDNIGRLVTVKDHEQNIVQHIEYENSVFRLNVAGVTYNSVTLLLTEIDRAAKYKFSYKEKDKDMPYQDVSISKGKPYVITGLNPNTEYVFKATAMDISLSLAFSNPVIAATNNKVYTLALSYYTLDLSNSGGTFTVNVTSDQNWTVQEYASWITVSPTTGSGNGTLTITVQDNSGSEKRTGTITVSGDFTGKSLNIGQQCGYCEAFCPVGYAWDSAAGKCMPVD